MKTVKKLVSGIISLAIVMSIAPSVFADGIYIDEKTFPDKAFRDCVELEIDIDSNGVLSSDEINAVKMINLSQKGLSDLTGIENFTELEYLFLFDNSLTSIDLSKNTKLKNLDVSTNKLTNIDLSANVNLECLDISYSSISSIDLSKNVNLTDLHAEGGGLTGIDLKNNTNLVNAWLSNNKIESIDVSMLPNLQILMISSNLIDKIDVSKNSELLMLDIINNDIGILDISNNPKLESLFISGTNIRSIDLSKNPELWSLAMAFTSINRIDISNNPKMASLFCGWSDLSEINIGNNPILLEIYNNTTPEINPVEGSEKDLNLYYNEKGDIAISISSDIKIVTEYKGVGDFVDRCYEIALGREADKDGYDYWVESLNGGKICGAQAGYGFIFSEEYTKKNTSDKIYVEDLYLMFFGRKPDEDGFNYWSGLLESGKMTREEVFAGFANSLEFDNLCKSYNVITGYYVSGVENMKQAGVNCFVARLYDICLNRLPDMAGQSGWVTKLINGEVTGTEAAFGFAFSQEFINVEKTPEEFVRYMYSAFFGREADSEGLNGWVEAINNGKTFEEVFAGFSGSTEFMILCAEYGITA